MAFKGWFAGSWFMKETGWRRVCPARKGMLLRRSESDKLIVGEKKNFCSLFLKPMITEMGGSWCFFPSSSTVKRKEQLLSLLLLNDDNLIAFS